MENNHDHICYTCWIAQLGNPFDCRTREHREPQTGLSPEMEASRDHASQIYFGLKANRGRLWAERELKTKPDIEAETRRQLNLLLKVKK